MADKIIENNQVSRANPLWDGSLRGLLSAIRSLEKDFT